MTKIRDIIQINSGYTTYVDLYQDYYDLEKNRGRMERYKPIKAHRLAFETISKALNPKDRRFYFLSGSYGTGKSHLLLMLANYFANQSDVPELEAFFDNYEQAQSEVVLKPNEALSERSAASLKQSRSQGRYLVAICRFDQNLSFEGSLIRALENALERENSSLIIDSHYSEAIRRIEDWEKRQSADRFYGDLQNYLLKSNSDWTIDDIKYGLQRFDERALLIFKQCFQKITDTDFTFNKDNLTDITNDFLDLDGFRKEFKGIVFLYDEFGDAIDTGRVSYNELLAFAQYCANSALEKGGEVIFIGAGHKAFRNHGKLGDLNAETLAARVNDFWLETQGMEDIISAIVQPKKDTLAWVQEVNADAAKFGWFSGECGRLGLFNWLPAPKIKQNIIQDIFPMHPLATYALLVLAREVQADTRSVVRFFAPEFETGEQGWENVPVYSYPWFIERNDIKTNGKLSFYTPDLLVDYYQTDLVGSNSKIASDQVKHSIANYEATLRQLNVYKAKESEKSLFVDDSLIERIIKAILVNEIASTGEVAIINDERNICFALDMVSEPEKNQVRNRLAKLSSAGVIFNDNGVYQLIPGDRKDIQRMVDQFKADPNNRPSNVLQHFETIVNLSGSDQYLEAKEYNNLYNEDKRLKVVFATPPMLSKQYMVDGEEVSYFTYLDHERRNDRTHPTQSYEGCAVYVFCEDENDIELAKTDLKTIDHNRVAVAIPSSPVPITDAIATINAVESQWFRKQAQDFNAIEKAQQKTITDEAHALITKAKEDYFSNSKVTWFGKGGKEITAQENRKHDAANYIIGELFKDKRNTFSNFNLNKGHINLGGNVKSVFDEAGNLLVNLTQPIRINWSWGENRGGIRYLRNCFVNHQILKVTHTDGDTRILEAEKDISKFANTSPAYTHMLRSLQALENKGETSFAQFIQPFFEVFGQSEMAVTLYLLLARRYFGDSLRFKSETNVLNDLQFTETNDMLELVRGQHPSAVILFEPVSSEDILYFAKITQLFTNDPGAANKVYTVQEAYNSIVKWWDKLPIIARQYTFYDDENRAMAELMSTAKSSDPFYFVKNHLLNSLGFTPGEVLTSNKLIPLEIRLKTFKFHAESIQDEIQRHILKRVAQIYGLESDLDLDIIEAMRTWYNNLSATQKGDPGYDSFHNNDSKPLVKFTSYSEIRPLLFVILPEAYGIGKVQDWVSDYVANYTDRIRRGKDHIDNAVQVPEPKISFTGNVDHQRDQVTFQGELHMHVAVEGDAGTIFYTVDGSDPKQNNANRQQLQPGDTLTIKGNRKVKFVISDREGNFSAVRTVTVFDELTKHKIVRPKQRGVFEDNVTFLFPKNKQQAETTVMSLLEELLNAQVFTHKEDLVETITQLIEKFNANNPKKD